MKVSMQVSLVENFNSIQEKIEAILKTEKLDVKQISDLERFIGMQNSILDTLSMLKKVSNNGKGESDEN